MFSELTQKFWNNLADFQDYETVIFWFSALEAPKAAFGGTEMYPTVLEKAAVYLYHLIKNHPFSDGNKRTAYAVTLYFLEINNVNVQFKKTELEEAAVRVADGQMTKAGVLAFFESTQALLSLS